MEKFTIKDNTVSSLNQVVDSSKVYFLGKESSKNKILVLGNSITRHGPKPEIGWENDWGMAASAPENDYVHLLDAKLSSNAYDCRLFIRQASVWERNYLSDNILDDFVSEKEFCPDIIIFRLGENSSSVNTEEKQKDFYKKLCEFIDYLSAENTKVIFCTCIWKNKFVDETIRRVSSERNMPLCDLNFIGEDESNLAIGKFRHKGVAGHPGDKGMIEIANAVFDKMKPFLK